MSRALRQAWLTRTARRLSFLLGPAILIFLFWVTAGVSDFFLDRPFVYTTADEWSTQLVRSVARFPNAFECGLYATGVPLLFTA
ncbi:MAG TPA: hypothetical protein VNW92_15715, partial [Polyangiaceae bacterium]|nr:hypothetical protein [Polyangiaceae bacterium]